MPVYNKRGILLLPKVIVLNPKDGHIVNFYHGTIRVTSQLEEGTEFVVTIPLNWKDL